MSMRYYMGHFCKHCSWWRYGEFLRYSESQDLHSQRECGERVKALGEWNTGRGMQQKLEGKMKDG